MTLAAQTPLGLAHFTVLEVPPLDLVSLAASTGFASIGLRLHPAFPGAPFYELPPGSAVLREMRSRLVDEGVRVHDIEFVTIAEDFTATRLAPILEAAGELGARRISVCGDDPVRARLIANIAALSDLAARFGIGVDLEFMAWRRVASLAAAVDVMTAVGHSEGGVLVDALHLARTGGTPRDLQGVPAHLIRSAQLCDAPAAIPSTREAIIHEARAERLAPGEGELPLRQLLAGLPAAVALSVEVPMADRAPAETRLQRIRAATRRVLEQG